MCAGNGALNPDPDDDDVEDLIHNDPADEPETELDGEEDLAGGRDHETDIKNGEYYS